MLRIKRVKLLFDNGYITNRQAIYYLRHVARQKGLGYEECFVKYILTEPNATLDNTTWTFITEPTSFRAVMFNGITLTV